MAKGHLYKGEGTPEREKHEFEERYGKEKGDRVYSAVVGKVYRERHGGKNWNTGKHYHEHGEHKTGRTARRRHKR